MIKLSQVKYYKLKKRRSKENIDMKNKTNYEVNTNKKKKKKLLILLLSLIGLVAIVAIGRVIWNNVKSESSVTNNHQDSSEETTKDGKKNDQKKDDKKDNSSKNDKKADEKKNDVKETENKTETSNNSGNTNSNNNSTSTVKPSNNTSTNNTTTTTTKPSNTTSNNTSTTTNNNSSANNNSSSQPTGCTPVYETVTVTDVPAQPIYGEEQYLISAEEPIYQEKPVYMTSDGVAFEPGQEDDLTLYCADHNVSYYTTTVKTQVGTKPAQYGTRQIVTGYTEPVTHTEQRQVDCK